MKNYKNNNLAVVNNILIYGSCLLVLILPIFYLKNTFYLFTAPKTFLFYGVVEILLFFWIYALAVDKSYRLKKETLYYFIPLFLFIIWMTISGFLAVNPALSLWSSAGRGTGLLTLYHCLSFCLIIASLVKKNGNDYLYKLIDYFLTGGVLLAISVWFGNEGFNFFSLLKDSNGGGLMGNSSLTAAYLIFILFFGISSLFSNNKNINKVWLLVKISIILFSPLFINIYGLFSGNGLFGVARGATLGIFIGIGASLIFYLAISKKKVFKLLGFIGIFVSILGFAFFWMHLRNPDTFIHKKFTEAASGTRFVFNEISQKSIDKHPYFGYGPENYQIAFQENLNPEMALPKYGTEVWTDRAHNIYYDTGVSGGYPAIVFYALFLFSVLYGLYNLKNKDILNNLQISILGGLLVGYAFQNLFVFDSSLSIMVLYVLAGIIFVKNDTSELEKKIPKVENGFIKEGLPVILFVCCLLSLIFFVFRPMQKILRYYSVAQMSMNSRGIHFKDLIGGSVIGEAWDISEIGNHIYKLYNADILKIKNDPSMASYGVSDIKGLIDYLEVIQSKNKTDARLDITIVSLYNTLNFLTNNPYDPILGDHMLGLLEHAKTISPNNPAIYWVMAQTYVWKADYNAVVDSYKKAIALDPRIPESHRLLLNFAKNTENNKLYDETLREAQKNIQDFNPEQLDK